MHLSMHNWMRAEDLDVALGGLARCGYESIEISGEPEIYDLTEVRELLRMHDRMGRPAWGARRRPCWR